MRAIALALTALALVPACDIHETIGSTPDGGGNGEAWAELRLGIRTDNVDVLFMIDNSPSMSPKQAELRARFPELLDVLDQFQAQGSPGHYHLGVVTSDLGAGGFMLGGGQCRPGGDGGRLQAIGAAADPVCQPPTDGARYIDLDQTNGVSNLPPGQDLAATFTCMASVGDRGCGFEMPLEAVYQALHAPPPENAGFLRDDAILAVVFLTDEDDCSADPATDLFDPMLAATYGPLLSYRCTQYGVQCGNPPSPPPYGSSFGALDGCAAAPNPDGMGPGKLYDVRRYIDFFRRPASAGGVKANPSDVLLFAIDGPSTPFQVVLANPNPVSPSPSPSCPGPPDGQTCAVTLDHSCVAAQNPAFFGDPAVRLNAVVGSIAPGRSICDTSYAMTMQSLAKSIVSYRSGNGCLPAAVKDPRDPRCEAEDDIAMADGSLAQQRIPACAISDGAFPCWRVDTEPTCAAVIDPTGAEQRLQLTIDRGGAQPPPNTATHARCPILVP
jgi:hypothetical protein